MTPQIIENYTSIGIDVGRIVRRVVNHLSPDILDGLREIRILDRCLTLGKCERPFACYDRAVGTIDIYVGEMLGDFPRVMVKVLYPIMYMAIAMAVAHEMDHHVNRQTKDIDREASANANMMKYIYPSLGIFKPLVRVAAYTAQTVSRLRQGILGSKTG